MLTTSYVAGAPNWVDLGSPDIEASTSFYTELFGWTFQSAGPDAGGYGMFQVDGKNVAAIGPLGEEGASSAWTVYFHTPDADLTAKTVEQAGGAVRFAPFDVFAQGRMAGFTDPTGAEFAVWQPGETRGLDMVTKAGSLCWTELHTADAMAARTFYHTVFGWDAEDNPMPGGMTYTVISISGGGRDASIGGVMQLGDEARAAGTTSHWLPYFEVTDVDTVVATARGNGGGVLMGPADMEGVGRMAALTDPFGARFSVIKSEQPS
jgi:uncharacterized protein